MELECVQECGDSPSHSTGQSASTVEQLKYDNDRLKLALTQRSYHYVYSQHCNIYSYCLPDVDYFINMLL